MTMFLSTFFCIPVDCYNLFNRFRRRFMPTLTTDKIIAKLNSYFTDNQYVFWYDDKQEFKDIIDSIAQRLSSTKLKQTNNSRVRLIC